MTAEKFKFRVLGALRLVSRKYEVGIKSTFRWDVQKQDLASVGSAKLLNVRAEPLGSRVITSGMGTIRGDPTAVKALLKPSTKLGFIRLTC